MCKDVSPAEVTQFELTSVKPSWPANKRPTENNTLTYNLNFTNPAYTEASDVATLNANIEVTSEFDSIIDKRQLAAVPFVAGKATAVYEHTLSKFEIERNFVDNRFSFDFTTELPHHTLCKSYKETAITLDSSDLNWVASFSVVYL
ncbi:hypothetical protein CIPA99_01723 [Corynebacterium diphtheriae]|uniref:hypothetical protein n=1 Tax=Corynebacterium diphtheriae TaxID=1717 RepID=UPI00026028F8|nr:hypothetical protein [Corynebacterium diphtheriae]EIK55622.1 hypothetical protein W5M_08760 [Corynebacterium diphtheriae bv. intermedius str. NCTC 5011]CAB0659372.1 hypothetical protein CIPA99_01723 [Corynebacterium diphtheriae]